MVSKVIFCSKSGCFMLVLASEWNQIILFYFWQVIITVIDRSPCVFVCVCVWMCVWMFFCACMHKVFMCVSACFSPSCPRAEQLQCSSGPAGGKGERQDPCWEHHTGHQSLRGGPAYHSQLLQDDQRLGKTGSPFWVCFGDFWLKKKMLCLLCFPD